MAAVPLLVVSACIGAAEEGTFSGAQLANVSLPPTERRRLNLNRVQQVLTQRTLQPPPGRPGIKLDPIQHMRKG
ncbi:hypothetical protein GCM10023194_40190 [Planotetraspora phitsanulokensis]|uniref:Uncharacterized protein n=1 Tax=Planotetraspora phitsanulokensis TaxID=575192 RepID=A0A8J3UEQ2_9ACTN|nr:hypothetical protein Pph01_59970 [Planotetraspora phitsanulokensis]